MPEKCKWRMLMKGSELMLDSGICISKAPTDSYSNRTDNIKELLYF